MCLMLRSPQLHHGAVFSLFCKGERPLLFLDYILDSILLRRLGFGVDGGGGMAYGGRFGTGAVGSGWEG